MKFKKQGEGILKLLAPKISEPSTETEKENAELEKRLVLRQKGTWTILLNSPLSLATKFETMPQMASGYGVRFVGLDHSKGWLRSFMAHSQTFSSVSTVWSCSVLRQV